MFLGAVGGISLFFHQIPQRQALNLESSIGGRKRIKPTTFSNRGILFSTQWQTAIY